MELCFRLGKNDEVFDTELHALVQLLEDRKETGHDNTIFSDSEATLQRN